LSKHIDIVFCYNEAVTYARKYAVSTVQVNRTVKTRSIKLASHWPEFLSTFYI